MHKIRKLEKEDTYPFTAVLVSLTYFTLVVANNFWRFNPMLVDNDYSTMLIAVFMGLWGLHWFTFDEAVARVKSEEGP